MSELKGRNTGIKYLAYSLLVLAYIFSLFLSDNIINDQLYEVFNGAENFKKINNKPLTYAAYKNDGQDSIIGYVTLGSAVGYGGPLDVLVASDTRGDIVEIKVVNHKETPSFFFKVIHENFLDQFDGESIKNQFKIGEDIDAISGATLTSRGISNAVKQASHHVAVNQLNMEVLEGEHQISLTIRELSVVLLFVLSIMGIVRSNKRIRWISMITSIFVLGFWLNSAIAIANFVVLVKGFMPSVYENLLLYLLIFGVIGLVLFFGKNVYCYWLCPFGALQEIMGKIGGTPIKINSKVNKGLMKLPYLLAWIAVMIALLKNSPGISSYEPFGNIFGLQGLVIQWLLIPVILIASMFISRFWCKYFCPVGVVMYLLVRLRQLLYQWFPKLYGGIFNGKRKIIQ